jgi:hypothetical protein
MKPRPVLLTAFATAAAIIALAAPSVLSSLRADSQAEVTPFPEESLTPPTTGQPTSSTLAPTTAPPVTYTTTAPPVTYSTTKPVVATTKPQPELPTSEVLQQIYQDVDAAARFFGDGGSLSKYSEKVAAISKKWAAHGLVVETGYENGKDYYYLMFGKTEYCLERVSEAGTFRAYPTSCP